MHDLVRTFVQEHDLITTLAQTPDVAWTWIHDGLEALHADLEPREHDELARECYKLIAARWKAEMQGSHRALHCKRRFGSTSVYA